VIHSISKFYPLSRFLQLFHPFAISVFVLVLSHRRFCLKLSRLVIDACGGGRISLWLLLLLLLLVVVLLLLSLLPAVRDVGGRNGTESHGAAAAATAAAGVWLLLLPLEVVLGRERNGALFPSGVAVAGRRD